MLNVLFNETDDYPVRTIKQAINQTAEGLKCSLAATAVASAFVGIFLVCSLIDLSAFCAIITAIGAWCSIACLVRYDMHTQSLIKLYELRNGHDLDDTIDF